MASSTRWNGTAARAGIVAKLLRGGDAIGFAIEAAAKAELYPGHGKVRGHLKRAVQSQGAREERTRIIIRVGVKGVPYARRIHRLYGYLTVGMEKTRPRMKALIRKHAGG